ncbi:hypothetical protein [Streptomyces macrolidinus]|uniref:hypothetical protein n=1 Tax=Streptomyces macrolidinus TaxID=2952607 RepID=UPI0025AA28F8|nr:hypothetical protein [Streptomyces macrolidinus]
MSRRTIRSSRVRSATLVSAGAVAVALNVVPSTTAVADAIHRSGADSAVALPGPKGAVSLPVGGGGDHDKDHGRKGKQGPQGPQGTTGPQGPQGLQGVQGPQGAPGFATVYTVVGPAGSQSIANCNPGDVAVGGGYRETSSLPVSIKASRPLPGTQGSSTTGWQAVATPGAHIVAYAVCTTRTA